MFTITKVFFLGNDDFKRILNLTEDIKLENQFGLFMEFAQYCVS